ncbi:MAG: carboxypeptidase-like regulatory domain-containing protein [Candidatus Sericytochromatia bacterium]|nr:carboxypeptidase-like regulatory domain-containing protein [Candidatus Sericytochromatia bacterium]
MSAPRRLRPPLRAAWPWLLLAAVGCQAGPGAAPAPGPATPAAGGGSAAPAAAAGTPGPAGPVAGPSPVASPAPAVARAVLVGAILDDRGRPVEASRLEVKASDPAYDRVITATGGAFGLRDLPVGLALTLTASAPGFTTRTRTAVVQPPSATDEAVNRVDFGGSEAGMWHCLFRHPEIARVEPANLARDVAAEPLKVVLTFSHALDADDRGRLQDLLRVAPTYSADEAPLSHGVAHGAAVARLAWDDDGRRATFTYPGPIVARQPGHGLSVEFDPAAGVQAWPRDEVGQPLGMGLAPRTRDGGGGAVTDRVAPFVRGVMDEPRPSVRPSPLALWGFTHHTSARFELARDLTPLKVEAVDTLAPDASGAAGFLVTFNKPIWAYPASALASATTEASSFRYVVGSTADRREREAFEQADARAAATPGLGVRHEPKFPRRLQVRVPASRFDGMTRFKLHVGPQVEDVYGVTLGGDGVVIEGSL